MKATIAGLLLLICSTSLGSQSVRLAGQLRPFRINRLVVTNLPDFQDTRIEITGWTVHDRQIPLFSAAGADLPEQLECFLYIDDSVRSVRVQISSPMDNPEVFEYPTRLNPHTVTVYSGPGRVFPQLSGYRFTSSAQGLDAGDILVLEDARSPETKQANIREFSARGVHVITTQVSPETNRLSLEEETWRGNLLLLESLDTAVLTEVLQSRRGRYAAFKKRFYDRIAGAGFYGIPPPGSANLKFVNSRVEDIAAALEHHHLPNRLTGFHRVALLGFSLIVIILVILVRRTVVLLSCLAALLGLFVFLSFLHPDPDRSLHLQLNPSHLSSSQIELVRTTATGRGDTSSFSGFLPPGMDTQHFAPHDYTTEMWSLNYGLIRSTNRQIPLSTFIPAALVKFDQIPRIERIEGGYVLKYVNPLRYWSLHEPD